MAFQEQTVSGVDDLISKLQTFALANGWFSASGGVFQAESGDTNAFTVYNDTANSKPSISISTPLSARVATCSNILNFSKVWFKCEVSPRPWIMVVIRDNESVFRHLGFGYLDPYDGVSVCPFVFGTYTRTDSNRPVAGSFQYYIAREAGYLLADAGIGFSCARPGYVADGSTVYLAGGTGLTQAAGTGFCGGGIPSLIGRARTMGGINGINSQRLLSPLQIWVQDEGSIVKRFLGTIPIYYASLQFITPETIVTIGGVDDYIFFPLGVKASNASKTANSIINSGVVGLALKVE